MRTRKPAAEHSEPAPVSQHLAILFGDLEGATAVAAAVGDLTFAEILRDFFRRVASLQTVHDGRILKTFGDGFLALFEDGADAFHFAIALQQSLAHEPLLAGQRMALRVSLHAGSVVLMKTSYGEDVFGVEVNLAAHLGSQAQPGQIVVSEAACQMLNREQQSLLGPCEHVSLHVALGQVTFRRLDVMEG